jgi:hypothetical protein
MSISRTFDEYLNQQGITPQAEVIPENECQIFLSELPKTPIDPAAQDDVDRVAAQIQSLFSS